MQLALVQFDIAWHDRSANLAWVEALLDATDLPTGAMVVLPEMFATGFSMEIDAVAEPDDRPTERWLRDQAVRRGVWMLAGLVTRRADGRGRNEAVIVSPAGELVTRFAKLHPFTPADEHHHYAAGDHVVVSPVEGWRVAPLVCYDLRFPEAFRSAAAGAPGTGGADLFVVIASFPFPTTRRDHWQTLLRARAIENQAYVVGVNRVGADPNHRYEGQSMVVDPLGKVIADAGAGETVLQVAIDHDWVKRCRQELPWLADRRADSFEVRTDSQTARR